MAHSVSVRDVAGKTVGKVELSSQFFEEVREDLIGRAVHAQQSHRRQVYGPSPEAGKRHSARVSRRRRDYKTSYGAGISRSPRKILSRNGARMFWVGAIAPNTVGGRIAHPPALSRIFSQKINIQERRKAIRSALSAVIVSKYVSARGHAIPKEYPFVLDNSFESLAKTKDVFSAMQAIGLGDELSRVGISKIRAGRGKMRGRRIITKVGPLLVVSATCPLSRAARNIVGCEIISVTQLNAESLAPGTQPGRLTLFTVGALQKLKEAQLFL